MKHRTQTTLAMVSNYANNRSRHAPREAHTSDADMITHIQTASQHDLISFALRSVARFSVLFIITIVNAMALRHDMTSLLLCSVSMFFVLFRRGFNASGLWLGRNDCRAHTSFPAARPSQFSLISLGQFQRPFLISSITHPRHVHIIRTLIPVSGGVRTFGPIRPRRGARAALPNLDSSTATRTKIMTLRNSRSC